MVTLDDFVSTHIARCKDKEGPWTVLIPALFQIHQTVVVRIYKYLYNVRKLQQYIRLSAKSYCITSIFLQMFRVMRAARKIT